MKKQFLTILFMCAAVCAFAREQRNFLATAYSPQRIAELLPADDSWVTYPAYTDRAGWEKIPAEVRAKYVKNAEKYLGYVWPVIRATDYLEFTRSGNRQIMEKPFNERRAALQALALGELAEGKGRFLDDLINGVFLFCEQTYWGYSAHFYMYKDGESPGDGDPTTNMPDLSNPIIDLGVGEVAADLAWIWHFFRERFDEISPVISRRIEYELRNKVMEPFYARDDYWWITGWRRGDVNNWNPWCNFNVLNVVLLLEKDPVKKAAAVYKSMVSVDLFFNAYPNDGACDEGPSYWNAAGAKAFDFLNLLAMATKGGIDLFDQPLIKDIGRYIYRVYIANGKSFTNFADAPALINPRGGLIYRYGQRIGDETMKGFGAFLMARNDFARQAPVGSLEPVLEDLFCLEGWEKTAPAEPLVGEYFFPDMQIAVARSKEGTNDGFYFAAKAGNNGEGHNHNDVGSCLIFYNGNPVIVDAGVGTYTKETFTSGRYKIWTMQSAYHNVPLINGVQQSPGRSFKASGVSYKSAPSSVMFSADIAGAYPAEAGVAKWIRGYELKRNKSVRVTDNFELKETNGETQSRFLTPLSCRVVKPGLVELKGKDFTVQMTYAPSQYTASIEAREIDDPRMKGVWGDRLSVVVLTTAGQKKGNFTVEFTNH